MHCPRCAFKRSKLTTSPTPRLLVAVIAVAVAAAAGVVSGASCYRSFSPGDFPRCKLLSPSYALHWVVAEGNVTLGMDADTGGYTDSWVAVALSAAGGMIGADVIIVAGPNPATDGGGGGGGSGGGGWRVIDAHSLQFAQPVPDDQQDVTLRGTPVSGGGRTLAVVTRPLKTCDPWDWPIMVGVPQTLSWAYGRSWPSQHVMRGNSAVFFVPEADQIWGSANASAGPPDAAAAVTPISGNSAASPPDVAAATADSGFKIADDNKVLLAQKFVADKRGVMVSEDASEGADGRGDDGGGVSREDSDGRGGGSSGSESGGSGGRKMPFVAAVSEPVTELDVLMPNITIPDNQTTSYLCVYMTLPHDRKYHIVRTLGLPKSPLIHHMLLYACEDPPPGAVAGRKDVFSCLGIGGGDGCTTFHVGWAPGQDGGDLPPTVGLPMGERGSTYYSLQVHYNNPNRISETLDDSGFRLSYTPKLRPYDMGVLTVGQRAISIPPGIPNFTLRTNVCPSTCTSRLRRPLHVLFSGLHMHTLGRSMLTRHVRNGTELPPLGSKRFYDFNFQSLDPVPLDSSVLLAGDVLLTTCSYDSTSRTNTTRYGESTTDEMCFNFIMYYPRDLDFMGCTSMDAAGDPWVAMCGSSEEVAAVGAALEKLLKPPVGGSSGAAAMTAASPAAAAMDGGGGATRLAVQKPHVVNLSAVPSLAPFFESGVLERVPLSDLQYVPYSKDCPSMWYAATE